MMALVVDQQSNGYKHFCKICSKGYMCGRALGGHMRTHGIGDHSYLDDDDPDSADWDGPKTTHASTGTNNNINSNIDVGGNNRWKKGYCACENCGKEFSSWKSLIEHRKCGVSDDLDESLASSLGGSEYHDDEDDGDDGRRGCRWSKRKRSKHVKLENFGSVCPSCEEEDLANCLMMLSSGMVDIPPMAEPEELCAFACRDEDQRRLPPVSFISRLTYMSTTTLDKVKGIGNNNNNNNRNNNNNNNGIFECMDCKKVFNSHQALGGHRASHKKVKGQATGRSHRDRPLAATSGSPGSPRTGPPPMSPPSGNWQAYKNTSSESSSKGRPPS